MNRELTLKIINLHKNDPQGEAVEAFLEKELEQNPTNLELWFRLAIVESEPPFIDYEKCFFCLNQIFKYDKHNVDALLLQTYWHKRAFGVIPHEVVNQLTLTHSSCLEQQALQKYALSWHFKILNNLAQEEFFLRESIALYDKQVYAYVALAKIYYKKGLLMEGKEFVGQALQNVTKVYSKDSEYLFTDINEYKNEYIKGVFLTQTNFESIQKLNQFVR